MANYLMFGTLTPGAAKAILTTLPGICFRTAPAASMDAFDKLMAA